MRSSWADLLDDDWIRLWIPLLPLAALGVAAACLSRESPVVDRKAGATLCESLCHGPPAEVRWSTRGELTLCRCDGVVTVDAE